MARIHLYSGDDAEVQLLINHFLAWMPKAMVRYKQIAERALREKEAMQREHLRAEQEKLEQRERLKRNIKFRRET